MIEDAKDVPGQYTSNKVLDQYPLSCSPQAAPPEKQHKMTFRDFYYGSPFLFFFLAFIHQTDCKYDCHKPVPSD